MFIEFLPLQTSHFPLLLKWLETPHVKRWWDQDVQWTASFIEEKYGSYVEGYKFVQGVSIPIQAFVIAVDSFPIGYIQLYNAIDFWSLEPWGKEVLKDLPLSSGALDFFIGEGDFLGKGMGERILKSFLITHCDEKYEVMLVDSAVENRVAIRLYEKVGFCVFKKDAEFVWMKR